MDFQINFYTGHKSITAPCTPLGCVHLLQRHKVPLRGANVVIVGRSLLVGKPLALLLQSYDATVTVCHSQTINIERIIQDADIIVVAIGKPQFLQASWIKEGAVVLDVGINCLIDSTSPTGYRLVGDVDFEHVKLRT